MTVDAYSGETADLALSLDVVYHLIEDEVYDRYMSDLFASARRLVVVYSSNRSEDESDRSPAHIRHRKFTDWVAANAPDSELLEVVENDHPFRSEEPDETSWCDFYVFG